MSSGQKKGEGGGGERGGGHIGGLAHLIFPWKYTYWGFPLSFQGNGDKQLNSVNIWSSKPGFWLGCLQILHRGAPFRSLRNDNNISRHSNFHFQNFIIVVVFPKRNSVFGRLSSLPPIPLPQKKQTIFFIVVLPSLTFALFALLVCLFWNDRVWECQRMSAKIKDSSFSQLNLSCQSKICLQHASAGLQTVRVWATALLHVPTAFMCEPFLRHTAHLDLLLSASLGTAVPALILRSLQLWGVY